jgi:hypothetical protein
MPAPPLFAAGVPALLYTAKAVDQHPDARIAAMEELSSTLLPGFGIVQPEKLEDEVTDSWAEPEGASGNCWEGGEGAERRAYLCENLGPLILPALAAVLMDREPAVMYKGVAVLAQIGAALG